MNCVEIGECLEKLLLILRKSLYNPNSVEQIEKDITKMNFNYCRYNKSKQILKNILFWHLGNPLSKKGRQANFISPRDLNNDFTKTYCLSCFLQINFFKKNFFIIIGNFFSIINLIIPLRNLNFSNEIWIKKLGFKKLRVENCSLSYYLTSRITSHHAAIIYGFKNFEKCLNEIIDKSFIFHSKLSVCNCYVFQWTRTIIRFNHNIRKKILSGFKNLKEKYKKNLNLISNEEDMMVKPKKNSLVRKSFPYPGNRVLNKFFIIQKKTHLSSIHDFYILDQPKQLVPIFSVLFSNPKGNIN
mmetsp:Transcript_892/g.1489  ORF Transcript_892/g.1489 Transcript_892/m.1489 type:complete len:299 (-) Transcript_892:726-1622(-)